MDYQTISEYVDSHSEEATTFLQNYLRIPSPTGQEKESALYLASFLENNGFNTELLEGEKDRPNLLMDWKGGEGKTLLFNGHLDVFPPESNPTRDPWSGEIIGDKIYARGATDMKSGNAAGIMAITFLKRLGFKPSGTISLALNCDEEQGSRAGLLYCMEKGLMKADFTICMEASEETIIVDTDGRIAWKLEITSDGWHAGTRLAQEDALQKAHKVIEKIHQYDKKLMAERYFPEDTSGAVISVTSISAGFEGKTVNMHPAKCTLWIDRRYTRGESIESAQQEFLALLDNIPQIKGAYSLTTLFAGPRLAIDSNHPDIIRCMDVYRTVFSKPLRPGRRSGAGDAGKLANAYKQNAPHFGPGIFAVLGSDDEHVNLSQYLKFIKTYMLFSIGYFEGQK